MPVQKNSKILHAGGRRFAAALIPRSGRIPGHTTRAPQVGFELETDGFQFYAIANLDKTSQDIIPGLHFLQGGFSPQLQ